MPALVYYIGGSIICRYFLDNAPKWSWGLKLHDYTGKTVTVPASSIELGVDTITLVFSFEPSEDMCVTTIEIIGGSYSMMLIPSSNEICVPFRKGEKYEIVLTLQCSTTPTVTLYVPEVETIPTGTKKK